MNTDIILAQSCPIPSGTIHNGIRSSSFFSSTTLDVHHNFYEQRKKNLLWLTWLERVWRENTCSSGHCQCKVVRACMSHKRTHSTSLLLHILCLLWQEKMYNGFSQLLVDRKKEKNVEKVHTWILLFRLLLSKVEYKLKSTISKRSGLSVSCPWSTCSHI